MERFKPLFLATALAASAATHGVSAAPCVGFGAVQDTDAFCGAVEWLKNRAITLGCGATSYCPFDNVTRAQMALFMNRLGKALTPVVLHKQASFANHTIASPAGGQLICATDDHLVDSYPRLARFRANLIGGTINASWIIAWVGVSTDQGVTWAPVPDWLVNHFPGRDWGGTGQVAAVATMAPPMDLAVGTTYRFGVFATGNGGTYTFNPLICQLEVAIANRNPATSPFDVD